MNRLYSMRRKRAPTAAEVESPPPPPSTAKSSKILDIDIGHAIRRTAGGVLSPALAKKLAQMIKMEKNTLRSMEAASRERMDAAIQLSNWGADQDEDVSDVTDKLAVLLYEAGDLEDQYVDRHDQYRRTMKAIRDVEKSIQTVRDRLQKVLDDIQECKTKKPDSPELPTLEQELVRAEAESLVAEAQLSNTTHEKLKQGFQYQFAAMREYGEKLAILASYGDQLLALLDESTLTPGEKRSEYKKFEASTGIVADCDDALSTWTSSNAAVTAKLSSRQSSLQQQRENTDEQTAVQGENVGVPVPLAERPQRRWSSDSDSAKPALLEAPTSAMSKLAGKIVPA